MTKGSEIVMQPSFAMLEEVIERLIMSIVESAHKLPRVEHVLFENLHGFDMNIPAMEFEDEVVLETKARALNLISINYPGPEKLVQICCACYSLFFSNQCACVSS